MTDQTVLEAAAACERCGRPWPTPIEEKVLRRPSEVDEELRERDG